jgi:hypothetical protein
MKRIADLDPDQLIPPQRAVYDEVVSGPRKGVCGPLSVSPIELDDHFR